MTGILGQLNWESLKKRRKDNRLILLYKGLKGKARIPTDDLIPKTRRGRNQHSLAFQIPSASKDVYKYSFFPQTIRDWNDLPESLISSSELSDDSVSTFTSLVRARDLFPPVTAPGEGLSIWRFTNKLFRFRFRKQPPWERGTKVYINGPGHMTKMATRPIYGKNLKKSSSPEPEVI